MTGATFGRGLRKIGLVFTTDQVLRRWEERGGPGRFTRWTFERPRNHLAVTMATPVISLLLLAICLRPFGSDLARFRTFALAWLIGMWAGTLLLWRWKYRRERAVYDRWRSGEHSGLNSRDPGTP